MRVNRLQVGDGTEVPGCTGACDIKHGVFESVCVTCGLVVEEVVVTPEHGGCKKRNIKP